MIFFLEQSTFLNEKLKLKKDFVILWRQKKFEHITKNEFSLQNKLLIDELTKYSTYFRSNYETFFILYPLKILNHL
jgi:hypothetical protein